MLHRICRSCCTQVPMWLFSPSPQLLKPYSWRRKLGSPAAPRLLFSATTTDTTNVMQLNACRTWNALYAIRWMAHEQRGHCIFLPFGGLMSLSQCASARFGRIRAKAHDECYWNSAFQLPLTASCIGFLHRLELSLYSVATPSSHQASCVKAFVCKITTVSARYAAWMIVKCTTLY